MKIVRVNEGQEFSVSGIRCDRCGAEARPYDDGQAVFDFQEYLCVEFTSGYGAKAFEDGKHYSCELCERCVNELLGAYLRSRNTGWQELFVQMGTGRNPVLRCESSLQLLSRCVSQSDLMPICKAVFQRHFF